MSLFEAIVLGIVQGLTEFLPISSTAHLRIVPSLLGWQDPGAAFTAVIQIGTLVAVLVYFRKDIAAALKDFHRGPRASQESRLAWAVAIGTIPIVILGYLLSDHIEGPWRSLRVIAYSLIGVALLMALAEKLAQHKRGIDGVRLSDGLWVGLCQAVALIPGVSRSGATITGSLFLGFDRPTAARFSFLLSIPAIFLAGMFELVKYRDSLFAAGATPVIAATLAAFVVGYASIDFLMKFLRSHSTLPFVVYRVALGLYLLFFAAGRG